MRKVKVGETVMLTQYVERWPHGQVPIGYEGVVLEVGPGLISVKIDDPPPWMESCDGELCWKGDDVSLFFEQTVVLLPLHDSCVICNNEGRHSVDRPHVYEGQE